MQFLHDPSFLISNGISIAFGCLSVIISLVTYFKSKNLKEVTWERVSIVSVKGIKGVKLVTLKLWNSGKVDIAESDFRDPIKFNFGKGAKVANIKIVNPEPPGLRETAVKSFRRDMQYPNKIMIVPFLFNHKYSVTFQARVAGFRGDIAIENSTRIIGVYDILERRPLAYSSKGKLLFYSIAVIISGQAIGHSLESLLHPISQFGLILGSLILFSIQLLESFAPAVFFGYAFRWPWKLKSFTPLFIRWFEVALLLAVINTLLIVTTFQ